MNEATDGDEEFSELLADVTEPFAPRSSPETRLKRRRDRDEKRPRYNRFVRHAPKSLSS